MAYTIEEEQELNELKTWWQENYKSIIVIFVATLAAVFGWRYWQDYQVSQTQELSMQYEKLIFADQSDKTKFAEQTAQFVQANNKTSYAVFALLEQANVAVQNKDFAKAEQALKQAVSESSDELLVATATLRLAAVQFQLQQFDPALDSLKQIKAAAFDSRKHLLTGEILLAKGDKQAAKSSFEQAQKTATPFEQQLLQVRLNNL